VARAADLLSSNIATFCISPIIVADGLDRLKVGGGSFSWSWVEGRGGSGGTLKIGRILVLEDLEE
jgi:hypothetical protein